MKFLSSLFKTNCPSDDVFIKAFMQKLSLDEIEKLIDHSLICNRCYQKFELMKQLSYELERRWSEFSEGNLVPEAEEDLKKLALDKIKKIKSTRSFFFNLIPAKFIAAGIALTIIITGFLFITKIKHREVYREEGNEVEITLIKPSGIILEPPSIFSWTIYEGTDSYRFELIDDDLNTLYSKTANENHIKIPEEVRQKLKKGKTYIWKVKARDVNDNVLSSNFISFELR